MSIRNIMKDERSLMPDNWPEPGEYPEIFNPPLRATELEIHYYDAPLYSPPKKKDKAVFPSRTFEKRKAIELEPELEIHNVTVIMASIGYGYSKFPQRVCYCNARPVPHRHEDNGIWDCYTGSVNYRINPKTLRGI